VTLGNATKSHTFSNLWYKATFTFYVWIRHGTSQKLAGHSPAKCHARMPRKKNSTRSPAKIQTRTPIFLPAPGFFARPYYDWNVFNNIWIRYFNYRRKGECRCKWSSPDCWGGSVRFAGLFLRGSTEPPKQSITGPFRLQYFCCRVK